MSSSSSPRIRSYSKSQMYLFKILHIISSIPPSIPQQPSPNNNKSVGIGIDLNLTFSSITEESDNNNNSEIQEQVKAVDVDDVASELENEGETETETKTKTSSFHGDSNCIDLLIEAARVLSEKNESDSDSEEEKEKRIESELLSHEESVDKKKQRWVVVDLYETETEPTEPVVRSKRGRNQTLPFRFRDSVVEPLKRKGRSQRMSSTTHAKKRHLR